MDFQKSEKFVLNKYGKFILRPCSVVLNRLPILLHTYVEESLNQKVYIDKSNPISLHNYREESLKQKMQIDKPNRIGDICYKDNYDTKIKKNIVTCPMQNFGNNSFVQNYNKVVRPCSVILNRINFKGDEKERILKDEYIHSAIMNVDNDDTFSFDCYVKRTLINKEDEIDTAVNCNFSCTEPKLSQNDTKYFQTKITESCGRKSIARERNRTKNTGVNQTITDYCDNIYGILRPCYVTLTRIDLQSYQLTDTKYDSDINSNLNDNEKVNIKNCHQRSFKVQNFINTVKFDSLAKSSNANSFCSSAAILKQKVCPCPKYYELVARKKYQKVEYKSKRKFVAYNANIKSCDLQLGFNCTKNNSENFFSKNVSHVIQQTVTTPCTFVNHNSESNILKHKNELDLMKEYDPRSKSNDKSVLSNLSHNVQNLKNTNDCTTQYFCGECGKTFLSSKALYYHICYRKKKRGFLCEICQKNFDFYRLLQKHKLFHSSQTSLCCSDALKRRRVTKSCKENYLSGVHKTEIALKQSSSVGRNKTNSTASKRLEATMVRKTHPPSCKTRFNTIVLVDNLTHASTSKAGILHNFSASKFNNKKKKSCNSQ